MNKKRIARILGIAALGIIVKRLKERKEVQEPNEGSQKLNNEVTRIVDTVLIDSRHALRDTTSPVWMKLGHEYSGKNGEEATMTLEFVDAENTKIEVPFPKHQLIDNIGKMHMVANELGCIFDKEFAYT